MGSLEQAQITGFLCRLCSKMHRTVIHIYGAEGTKNQLEQKINNYLPVTVSPTDLLPKTICKQCLFRVLQHDKLMQTIQANHIKFKKLQSASQDRGILTRRRNVLLSSPSSSSSTSSHSVTSNSSNIGTSTESLAVAVGSDTDSIPDDNSNNATNNDSSTIGDDESLSVNSE